jgi:hypothetical protein
LNTRLNVDSDRDSTRRAISAIVLSLERHIRAAPFTAPSIG